MISVIVPVYKTAKYIPQCLNSILTQTYEDLEVIVINDASPDNSLDIVRRYAAKDSRIKIIDKKVNEGVDRARFSGLKIAKGEWVAFVDSDDWLIKKDIFLNVINCVHKMIDIDYFEVGSVRVFDKFGLLKNKNRREIMGEIVAPELFDNYYISFFGLNLLNVQMWGKFYSKEFLDKVILKPSGLAIGEDLLFNLQLFPHLKKIYIMDELGYAYRYGGMTSRYNPHLWPNLEYLFKRKLELIEEYNYHKAKDYVLIEIKNVLMSDVEQMVLYKIDTRAGIERLIAERLESPYWSMLKDVKVQANFVSQPAVAAILRKDAAAIYNLAVENNKSQRFKRVAKRIISKACQILR